MLRICRLCDVTLADASAWRQHFKSEAHVQRLQQKVAESASGDFPSQPAPASASSSARGEDWTTQTESKRKESEAVVQQDAEGSDNDSDDWEPPDFVSEQCLFCDDLNDSLDESLAHMETTHKFSIPRADHLVVEPETLIWYLNLVIRGYKECISCARGHATVDAAQQHMRAKGHCQFEITSELADFYDLPDEEEEPKAGNSALAGSVQVDENSLRLPSGKILSHRSQPGGPREPRLASPGDKQGPKQSRLSHAPKSASKELMTTEDFENAAVAPLMSRFSPADQQWLSRLPNHEVRALVLSTWRGVDESKREGKRELNRFGGSRGRTLMKHFRPSTPTRKSKWG